MFPFLATQGLKPIDGSRSKPLYNKKRGVKTRLLMLFLEEKNGRLYFIKGEVKPMSVLIPSRVREMTNSYEGDEEV